MSYKYCTAGLLILTLFLAFACAPRENTISGASDRKEAKSIAGQDSQISAKGGWEADWEKTLAAARKEGKVVVYALSSGPVIKDTAPQFKKKFGFELEVLALDRGPLLTAKLFSERKAGIYLADIYSGGTNTFFGVMKPAGMGEPMEPVLVLPEVVDPKVWYDGNLPWLDSDKTLFRYYAFPNNTVAVNTNFVKPDELTSYYDLLNPKWKGKILMNDPTIAGVGIKSFSAIGYKILNLDYFRQLAQLEPMIIRDQRLQVEWLAKEKYHILLFPRPAPMMEFKRAGAPVSYGKPFKEGTYLSAGSALALISKAPHPNAAKVFVNWFLSREGQLAMSPEGMQSSRVDTPTDNLDPTMIRQTGVKYFLGTDTEEWVARDPEFMKNATEILGNLIR